jgi:hypothetical protein
VYPTLKQAIAPWISWPTILIIFVNWQECRSCWRGGDLDGAFGREQCPYDLETIADIQKVFGILSKGYDNTDLEKIASKNWLNFMRNALPES